MTTKFSEHLSADDGTGQRSEEMKRAVREIKSALRPDDRSSLEDAWRKANALQGRGRVSSEASDEYQRLLTYLKQAEDRLVKAGK